MRNKKIIDALPAAGLRASNLTNNEREIRLSGSDSCRGGSIACPRARVLKIPVIELHLELCQLTPTPVFRSSRKLHKTLIVRFIDHGCYGALCYLSP